MSDPRPATSSPGPSARAARRAAGGTRERLLDAALALVREDGYAAASVAAVSARAGVAAGALYRHWPSKAELFADVFRTVCAGELDAMRAAASAEAPAGTRVEEVLATFATRALRSPRLAWALIAEPVDPLVEAERLAWRRAYRELLAGLLADGVRTGELAPHDPDLVAAVLVGGVAEALVGPTSPLDATGAPGAVVDELRAVVRGTVGAAA